MVRVMVKTIKLTIRTSYGYWFKFHDKREFQKAMQQVSTTEKLLYIFVVGDIFLITSTILLCWHKILHAQKMTLNRQTQEICICSMCVF